MTKVLVICQNSREAAAIGRAYFREHPEEGLRGNGMGPTMGHEVNFMIVGSSIHGRRFERIIHFNLRTFEWSGAQATSYLRWLREDAPMRLRNPDYAKICPSISITDWNDEQFDYCAKFVRRYVVNPLLP